jgi:hypothetical protein
MAAQRKYPDELRERAVKMLLSCCGCGGGTHLWAAEIAYGELRRLRWGQGADDARQRPFLVRVRYTAEDPAQVIAAMWTVLTCVVERAGDWPASGQRPGLVPVRSSGSALQSRLLRRL